MCVGLGQDASLAAPGDPCLSSYSCQDGDLCNGFERCDAGLCIPGPALTCDDGDPCTRDFCEPVPGCVHAEELCGGDCTTSSDGTRCADGTVCTRGDACAGGVCVPGLAVDCADGDACTAEECDPRYGCVYQEEAVEFPCLPSCNGAVADYTPCPGDDNVCTLDACLPSVDLIGDPHKCIIGLRGLERPCDDGDVCNGYEICSPTLGCEPGPPLGCDDGLLCNGVESCDPTLGCEAGTPAADGTGCDDGLLCTVADACAAGDCGGSALTPGDCSDGDGATADVCVEAFGCVHCGAQADLRAMLRGAAPGRGRLAARGLLPTGVLAGFSPASEVAAVIVEASPGGVELFRAVVPVATLVANPGGTRLRGRVSNDPNGTSLVLELQARREGIRWKLRAAGLTLGAPAPGLTVRVLLGDACFAAPVTCNGSAAAHVCR